MCASKDTYSESLGLSATFGFQKLMNFGAQAGSPWLHYTLHVNHRTPFFHILMSNYKIFQPYSKRKTVSSVNKMIQVA